MATMPHSLTSTHAKDQEHSKLSVLHKQKMSLPQPTTGTGMPTMDPKVLYHFEQLAEQSGGDLRRLLFAFFSFLNRHTDFYLVPNEQDVEEGVPLNMGFKEGDAEKLLLAAFRQFPLRRMPRKGSTSPGDNDGSNARKPAATITKSKSETKSVVKTIAASKSHAPSAAKTTKKNDGEIRLTEEGLQVPVGNGGSTKRYTWTQTIDETSVLVALPEGTKGKDVSVTIKPLSVSVQLKEPLNGETTPRTLLEGDLVEKIRTEESTWSLEGGVLVLTLDKLKKTWWETVIVGDDKIDTTLVDSRRHIGEYDGATQAAIRKIMFDQRQERLGLPTSDEMNKGTLPSGVEYITKDTLDKHESSAK
jgi:hypothetical protein